MNRPPSNTSFRSVDETMGHRPKPHLKTFEKVLKNPKTFKKRKGASDFRSWIRLFYGFLPLSELGVAPSL